MKVRFLPEGGFNKSGAFVETGDNGAAPDNADEFEIQRYLTLDIVCEDVMFGAGFEVKSDTKEVEADEDKPERQSSRSIGATGVIQKSRWSQFELSILGSPGRHKRMNVTISELPENELVQVGGVGGIDDIDLDVDESFYLSIYLTTERFDHLRKELSFPGAALKIRFDIGRFSNFFATWSPSISEGRVIKYLSSPSDVENESEVPDEFWRRARREKPADEDDIDFKFDLSESDLDISVYRPIGGAIGPMPGEPTDGDEFGAADEDLAPGLSTGATGSSHRWPNLEKLEGEITKIRRRLGVVSVVSVFALVVFILWSLG